MTDATSAAALLRDAAARSTVLVVDAAFDLISSGTLTNSLPIAAGETWRIEVEGIDLAPLTLRTS